MTPLRQRMIEDMQLRNLTPATQRNYVHHVAALARYYQLSPEHLDLEDLRQYELYLLTERKLAPETINGYVSAVKFLYQVTLEMPWPDAVFPRVRRPRTLPVVLSHEEVVKFFAHIPSLKYRAILMICYGAIFQAGDVVEKLDHFFLGQHHRQSAGPAHPREHCIGPGHLQRDLIQELDRGDVSVDGLGRQLSFIQQIQFVLTKIFQVQMLGTKLVVSG